WPTLEAVAIDYAVAEPAAAAGRVACQPGDFPWDDVGDFEAVSSRIEPGADGVKRLGPVGEVVAVDSERVMVAASDEAAGRVVAVVGLDDICVVETPDAILVTRRDVAQRVGAAPKALKARGLTDLL
ncbi:MAG: mannose-1-phosphate guanylyltransferase, partial [Bifidobacteriaceae bacterium]|nr:mannose-1-phosphate guanylyltransferase [Bifidobacteriaceae bacterium]